MRPTDWQSALDGGVAPLEMNWKSLRVGCGMGNASETACTAGVILAKLNTSASTTKTEIMEKLFLVENMV